MAEIIVTSTADSGAGSLRQAIAAAQDGDVILFDTDVFPAGQTTSILLSSYITINKSVSIYGGASDGAGGYTSGATKQYYVYRDVEGTRTKVVISDPDDAQDGETVLFENVCRVALDGQALTRGIQTGEHAEITISGIMFNNGGVATSGNSVVILDCCYVANATAANGAGIFVVSWSVATINDCAIYNCTTTGIGGGVYVRDNNSIATVNNCCFDSCSANKGGGLASYNTSQSTLNGCNIIGCSAASGGGVYSVQSSQNTLNGCIIDGCSATKGGGVFSTNTSQNTLNDCTISGCSATSNGGGIYSTNTSQNTLNDCIIINCVATINGGAAILEAEIINTLDSCVIKNCSATVNCGGIYAASTAQNTFNNCNISNCISQQSIGGVALYNTNGTNIVNNCVITGNIGSEASRNDFIVAVTNNTIINNSRFGTLRFAYNATPTFNEGITTAASLVLTSSGDVYPTVTITDGAALTITDSARIGAATFTSAGRGYLAVAAGIDTSSATLTNVVLCAYGADVSSFAEVDGVLEWEAANPTTTVLVERADGDSWTTVTQTASENLTLYLPPSATVRLFDGVQFFTAQAPDVRTYYYIGGAEGSFTSAADWSLRRGGVAITEPPVVRGQRFVVGDTSSGE